MSYFCLFINCVFLSRNQIVVLQVAENITSAQCMKCPLWHQPDHTKSLCIPCSNMCHCPSDYEDVNGTCVKDSFTIPDTPTIFTYNLHGRPYVSNYLRNWVRLTATKCKVFVIINQIHVYCYINTYEGYITR